MPATTRVREVTAVHDFRHSRSARRCAALMVAIPLALPVALGGCSTLGSLMSPYSEKFSCKNSDHGQCIHPEQAWSDAVAGRSPRSDPAVTRDKKMLGANAKPARRTDKAKLSASAPKSERNRSAPAPMPQPKGARAGAAIESAASPMLKPSRTIRTLILPYADRQRPDRLYMPRYVYSILGRPMWVVGDYLVEPVGHAPNPPVLRATRDTNYGAGEAELLPTTAVSPTLSPDHIDANPEPRS